MGMRTLASSERDITHTCATSSTTGSARVAFRRPPTPAFRAARHYDLPALGLRVLANPLFAHNLPLRLLNAAPCRYPRTADCALRRGQITCGVLTWLDRRIRNTPPEVAGHDTLLVEASLSGELSGK